MLWSKWRVVVFRVTVSVAIALLLTVIALPRGAIASPREYHIGVALPGGPQDAKRLGETIPEWMGAEAAIRLWVKKLPAVLKAEYKEKTPPSIKFHIRYVDTRDKQKKDYRSNSLYYGRDYDLAQYFVGNDENSKDQFKNYVAVIGHSANWRLKEKSNGSNYNGGSVKKGLETVADVYVYKENRLPLISPHATDPDIIRKHETLFSMTYDNDWERSVIAVYISRFLKRQNGKVIVFWEDTEREQNTLGSFETEARELERECKQSSATIKVVQIIKFKYNSRGSSPKHVKGLLDKETIEVIKKDEPAAIVLFAQTAAAAAFVKELRSEKIWVPIVVTQALANQRFANLLELKDSEVDEKIKKQLSESSSAAEARSQEHDEEKRFHPHSHPGLNVLLGKPFDFSLSPLKAQEDFRKGAQVELDAIYKEHSSKANSEANKQSDAQPTTDNVQVKPEFPAGAALWYDAAMLITQAVIEIDKDKRGKDKNDAEWSQNALLKAREGIRDRLYAVEIPGVSAKVFFPKNGKGVMPRDVLFGWVERGRFIPAYVQLLRLGPDGGSGDQYVKVRDEFLKKRLVVFTGIDFYRINTVDLSQQRFDAEFLVWFRWKDLIESFYVVKEPSSPKRNRIQFWNGIYGIEDNAVVISHKQAQSDGSVVTALKIKNTFVAQYDLKDYPFDRQRLSVRMSLERCPVSDVLLAVDKNSRYGRKKPLLIYPREFGEEGKIDPRKFNEDNIQEVLSGIEVYDSSLGDRRIGLENLQGPEYSVFQTNLKIERNKMVYLWKMFVPLCVLIVISILAFWVPIEKFDVRITVALTALLSTIVFHLSRTDDLPNVGYATLADVCFIGAYVWMLTNTAMIVWVRCIQTEEWQEGASRLFRLVSILFAIVGVVIKLTPYNKDTLDAMGSYGRLLLVILISVAGVIILLNRNVIKLNWDRRDEYVKAWREMLTSRGEAGSFEASPVPEVASATYSTGSKPEHDQEVTVQYPVPQGKKRHPHVSTQGDAGVEEAQPSKKAR